MVDDPAAISNNVLGTREDFYRRIKQKVDSGDDTEQKLMATSIQKYMQRDTKVVEGGPMKDCTVAKIGMSGTTFTLSEGMRPNRPLVLNFGSCS
jgi:hypothetical protein